MSTDVPINPSSQLLKSTPVMIEKKVTEDPKIAENEPDKVLDGAFQPTNLIHENIAEKSFCEDVLLSEADVSSKSTDLVEGNFESAKEISASHKLDISLSSVSNEVHNCSQELNYSQADIESPKDVETLEKNENNVNKNEMNAPQMPSSSSQMMVLATTSLPSKHTVDELHKSPAIDDSVHYVKWIAFNGSTVPTITQSENGPCPMIAIANLLLLRGDLTLPSKQEAVSSNFVIGALSEVLLSFSTVVS